MAQKPTRWTAQIDGFVIEPCQAEAMAKEAGASSLPELLPLLVPAARRQALPPISNFPVGAVGLGGTGRIYFGVNIEFPGLPLNHSVHAEQFLVANAAAHGEASLPFIAVSNVPCGHCRQFFQEIRGAAKIEFLVTGDGDAAAYRPLGSLLPHPFGPADLLQDDVPLLLEPHHNKIGPLSEAGAEPSAAGNASNGFCGRGEVEKKLKDAAAAAARGAHSYYSGCPAGFAVADAGGRVYAGAYAESAAYNPSLSPVQAAIISMVVAGRGTEDVVAAALVEKEAAAVSHEATARIFLATVAPAAHLKVYRFRSP